MSAGDIPIGDFSYPVTADLSTYQFYAVYLNGSTLALATNTTRGILGILQDNPNGATKATVGSVRELGHSKAWVDTSAILAGSPLKISATTGQLALSSSSSDVVVAVAVEANASTSSIIEVSLIGHCMPGTSARSGQMSFTFPLGGLTATGNIVASAPLGFAGTITDCYAFVNVVSASSSGSYAVTFKISGTAVTGLSQALLYSSLTARAVVASTKGTVALNTFASTDTLIVYGTQATTFANDTGTVTIYVVYN